MKQTKLSGTARICASRLSPQPSPPRGAKHRSADPTADGAGTHGTCRAAGRLRLHPRPLKGSLNGRDRPAKVLPLEDSKAENLRIVKVGKDLRVPQAQPQPVPPHRPHPSAPLPRLRTPPGMLTPAHSSSPAANSPGAKSRAEICSSRAQISRCWALF